MLDPVQKPSDISTNLKNGELKTLNSRYFELNLKIADQFKVYESKIREIISGKVARGKIECKIFFKAIDGDIIQGGTWHSCKSG